MKRLLFSVMVLTGLTAMQASAEAKSNPMDTDKDGKVSCAEYCVAASATAEKKGATFNEAAAKKQFKAKDKDSDGFLTGAELAKKAKQAPKAKAEDEDEGSDEE
jgi:hypothetical protein